MQISSSASPCLSSAVTHSKNETTASVTFQGKTEKQKKTRAREEKNERGFDGLNTKMEI